MSRLKLVAPAILTNLVSLMLITTAYAENVVEIITPVPAPKETVVVPPGYVGCFNVPSTWLKGVWYPEHRVCQYDSAKSHAVQGDAYVEAHWACTKYSNAAENKGECVIWKWKTGRWIKTFQAY